MLDEKNLYAYCDDNPITRSDSGGQLWHKLVEIAAGAVIGAALNVVTGGIAATVTGQKYTLKDMMAAAAAGAIAGGFSVAKYSSLKVLWAIAGGLFSGDINEKYRYKNFIFGYIFMYLFCNINYYFISN